MGGNCGKGVAFLNHVVGKGHAEEMKLNQRPEGGKDGATQIPRVRAFLAEDKQAHLI